MSLFQQDAREYRVDYEWDVEETSLDGDVLDHWHSDPGELKKLLGHCPLNETHFLVLVYNLAGELDGVVDRQWAYVDYLGRLPAEFDGGRKIPKKLREELIKVPEAMRVNGRKLECPRCSSFAHYGEGSPGCDE